MSTSKLELAAELIATRKPANIKKAAEIIHAEGVLTFKLKSMLKETVMHLDVVYEDMLHAIKEQDVPEKMLAHTNNAKDEVKKVRKLMKPFVHEVKRLAS